MKFTSIVVAFLVSKTSSFSPNAAVPAVRRTAASQHVFYDVDTQPRTIGRSTSLSLFGSRWRNARKLNAPANSEGDITENEVRALFDLWNAALATGDSRIVASRYTKVSSLLYFVQGM